MLLGTEVGFAPGHIVLDGTHKDTTTPTVFGPCLLWPNGWMDQDATWYIGLSAGDIVLDDTYR